MRFKNRTQLVIANSPSIAAPIDDRHPNATALIKIIRHGMILVRLVRRVRIVRATSDAQNPIVGI